MNGQRFVNAFQKLAIAFLAFVLALASARLQGHVKSGSVIFGNSSNSSWSSTDSYSSGGSGWDSTSDSNSWGGSDSTSWDSGGGWDSGGDSGSWDSGGGWDSGGDSGGW